MKIEITITGEQIANLMISAIESGDPVTTASRGGWCNGIKLLQGKPEDDIWYACPKLWDGSFKVEIIEVDDESTGHETKHIINRHQMARGLSVMAQKYGHLFGEIIRDNADAPCADIFLQCILFGEEKYA